MNRKQEAKLESLCDDVISAAERVRTSPDAFEADHQAIGLMKAVKKVADCTNNLVIDQQKAEQRDALRYED